MATDEKPNIIDSFRGLLDDHLGKKEFTEAFETVLKLVSDLKKSNDQEWTLIHSALQMLESKMRESSQTDFSAFRDEANTLMQSHISALQSRIAQIRDGMDGKDADEEKIVADVLARIQLPEQKEILLDTPEDIRNKLEVLNGDERLKASAISGLEDILAELRESVKVGSTAKAGWGAHPLQIAQSGSVKAKVARHINFTGATVTQNKDGTTTVAVSGGSLSVLTATGDVDNSNTVFTFASEPTLVIVNGATYRHGKGVTIATTTATLDNPVGVGGDIYALG